VRGLQRRDDSEVYKTTKHPKKRGMKEPKRLELLQPYGLTKRDAILKLQVMATTIYG